MAEEMELAVSFTVGQRIRGRMKYKRVPYFHLKGMTFDEYRAAKEIIMADLPPIAAKFLDLGYHVEYMGKRVDNNRTPDVNKH
jgi:hypothetical protein